MIKQGIINFFKNLKYFFTPLGIIALVCLDFSKFIDELFSPPCAKDGGIRSMSEGL